MKKWICKHKLLITSLPTLILFKIVWIAWACWNEGNLDKEKSDILQRRNWLIGKVVVEPRQLLNEMPGGLGLQFQGEWAIYATVMTSMALSNIAYIYPEYNDKASDNIKKLIKITLSDEIKRYDSMQWREDPISTLDGNKSHMTYLSLLATAIGHYKLTCNDDVFDSLYRNICAALNRRMLRKKDYNLPSFPNNIVFFPDMMFPLVALHIYSYLHNGEYMESINKWTANTKEKFIHKQSKLIISQYYRNGRKKGPKGSYSALNCSALSMFSETFAKEQYIQFKKIFGRISKDGKYAVVKEYQTTPKHFIFDIDAGPIVHGISPSGISFALGAATYFEDWEFRQQLLNTAIVAGGNVNSSKGTMRHYKLAEILLTGEAITLAMRTNIKRNFSKVQHTYQLT